MASRKVKELIDAFRNHFRDSEAGEVPLALRQEATDVVFTAMLEDDAPDRAGPSPVLEEVLASPASDPFGDLAAQFGPAMNAALGDDPALGGLLGAPQAAPEGMGAGADLGALLGGLE